MRRDIRFDINVIGLVNYIKRKNEYIFEESTYPPDEGTADIFSLDREHSLSVNMIAEIMYEGKGDINFFKSLLDELQAKNIIKQSEYLSIEKQREINARHKVKVMPTLKCRMTEEEYDEFLTMLEEKFDDMYEDEEE